MSNASDNNEKHEQARNLYFQTGLTQSQIAALIGVSQKTVSLWINEEKWKVLKERTEQAPVIFIEQMVSELQELHGTIAVRPEGSRFPTIAEAEIRRKIIASIKSVQQQQTAGVHAEMLTNFISYINRTNQDHAKILVQYADEYLKGEKGMSLGPQYKAYTIPASIDDTKSSPSGPSDPSAAA